MSSPWPPRHTARRPVPPTAVPREPVDHVRIGRRVVRRRAKGMDAAAVAQALEDARFDARLDSRHEHLADDEAGRAEPAEWERIDQLLADPAPDTVYDTDADDVVQEEFAADAAAADAREAELREAARIAARPMSSRRCASSAPWTNSSCGPPRTCRKTSTPGSPHALAAHLGYYADPAVRAAAADCRRICSPTPRCSPNSRTSTRTPASTSWRSRPGSPPPPKPPATSPRSSPAPGLGMG